jgi:sec-independent protein translocase protein TatA
MIHPLANMFGEWNWILIALVGLLFFGKRLPEVGRSLGKGIVEFKKGLAGVEEELTQGTDLRGGLGTTISRLTTNTSTPSNNTKAAIDAGYKFDPYTGKPLQVDPVTGQARRFDPYTGKPIAEETAAAGSTNDSPNMGI